jgi:tRNA threonylcarbamoyladenosine biosynthesis protein TsaE
MTDAALAPFATKARTLSLAACEAWARTLGASLPLPLVVTLSGPLGAGKTTVASAVLAGAGVTDPTEVGSPTFALVHEHRTARGPAAHLDLYRLRGPDDVLGLGFDDILERHALVLIEWADRAAGLLPTPHLAIMLDYDVAGGLDHRVVQVAVVGA